MKNFIKKTCLMLTFLLGITTLSNATQYYVDFDNGSDANNGLTTTASWKNIPGTKNTGNTGWVSGNTGWVKINAGDIITIKAGTTHTSSKGGLVLLDSTYYNSGTVNAPITINVSSTWGSGVATINGTGITVPVWSGLIDNRTIPYLILDGYNPNISTTNIGLLLTNSYYNNFQSIVSNTTVRYIESANSGNGGIQIFSNSRPSFINNALIEYCVSHDTGKNASINENFGGDWASAIFLTFVNNFKVRNNVAYNALYDNFTGRNDSSDGIHPGSCTNGVIEYNTVYNNGEQGIDISKDGDYKTGDNSYNITVRHNTVYNNKKMNLDSNSGSRDIYFINNIAFKTTETETGDGNFQVYEGGNKVYFIHDTSYGGMDIGFAFSWWSRVYNLTAGTYPMYIINSISTNEGGKSVDVETDYSSRSFSLSAYNSIFNSPAGGTVIKNKSSNYTAAQVNSGTFGTNCKSADPKFTSINSTFANSNFTLLSASPALNAGAFVFTIASISNNTITVTPLVSTIDVSRVFFAGDKVQVEGSGIYTVASVTSPNTIVFTSVVNSSVGKGLWYPWANTKPDMGYMSASLSNSNVVIPPPPPVSTVTIPNPPTNLRTTP